MPMRMEYIFVLAKGRMRSWKKNVAMASTTMKAVSGFMILSKEMPEAFIANSSRLSPRLPNVINEAKRMPSGNAIGTKVSEA